MKINRSVQVLFFFGKIGKVKSINPHPHFRLSVFSFFVDFSNEEEEKKGTVEYRGNPYVRKQKSTKSEMSESTSKGVSRKLTYAKAVLHR